MAARIHRQNCVRLRKGSEAFIFFYDDEDSDAVIQTISRFAADSELNLSWSDADALIRDVGRGDSAVSGRRF